MAKSKQKNTSTQHIEHEHAGDPVCCVTKICPRCKASSYVRGVQPPDSIQIIRCDNCGRVATPEIWGVPQADDGKQSPDIVRRTQ